LRLVTGVAVAVILPPRAPAGGPRLQRRGHEDPRVKEAGSPKTTGPVLPVLANINIYLILARLSPAPPCFMGTPFSCTPVLEECSSDACPFPHRLAYCSAMQKNSPDDASHNASRECWVPKPDLADHTHAPAACGPLRRCATRVTLSMWPPSLRFAATGGHFFETTDIRGLILPTAITVLFLRNPFSSPLPPLFSLPFPSRWERKKKEK
jgi:hypothetical protein